MVSPYDLVNELLIAVNISEDVRIANFVVKNGNSFGIGDGERASSLSPTEDIILCWYLTFIWMVSIYANGVIILGLSRQKGQLQALDVLTDNLAYCNGLLALLTYPMMVGSLVYHKWIFGASACKAYSFVTMLLGLTSVYTLLGIAAALFVTIRNKSATTKALRAKQRSRAMKYLVLAYTICAVLCFLPLVGVGEYGFGKHGTSCTVNWGDSSLASTVYLFILFSVGFFIPLLGIIAFYSAIVQQLRKSSARYTDPSFGNKWTGVKRKAIQMAVSVGLCVICCWTPYALVSLLQSFGDPTEIPVRLEAAAALLAKSSTAFAPLVHLWFTKKYRRWFQKFICCWRSDNAGELSSSAVHHANTSIREPTDYSPPFSRKSGDHSNSPRLISSSAARTMSVSSTGERHLAPANSKAYMKYIDRIVNQSAQLVHL